VDYYDAPKQAAEDLPTIADHRTILTQTKKTATTKVKKTAKTRMETLPLDDQLATHTDTINKPCGARSLTT
jgi:hypothetical protein